MPASKLPYKIALCLALCHQTSSAAQPNLTLPEISKQTLENYFWGHKDPQQLVNNLKQIDSSKAGLSKINKSKPLGLFITMSKNGQTRACWGSLHPQYGNIIEATVYTTLQALKNEYRFRPIRAQEAKSLKIQVSVIKGVEPVQTYRQINPFKEGMLVQSGGKSGILLPGEAKDSLYQLQKCLLKAGIKSGEGYQIFRVRCDVYD
jgi:AMMECR1 domain-containing protein